MIILMMVIIIGQIFGFYNPEQAIEAIDWNVIFLLAGMIGLFQGGIQALSRSLFSRLVPKGKEGEFFGFYNMLGKFAAVIGPILLGTVTLVTGDVRIGLLSIVALFIAGGLILSRVDFDEGERLASKYYS